MGLFSGFMDVVGGLFGGSGEDKERYRQQAALASQMATPNLYGAAAGEGWTEDAYEPVGVGGIAGALAGVRKKNAVLKPFGVPKYWQEEAQRAAQNLVTQRGRSAESRNLGVGARDQYLQALRGLQAGVGEWQRRASGEDSVVRRQAAAERDALQKSIASQAAGAMRGGFDPAAARASLMAQAGMGAEMAGDIASRAAQERLAAQQALQAARQQYLGGTGTLRQQDMAMRQQDLAHEQSLMDEMFRREAARQALMNMGLGEKEAFLGRQMQSIMGQADIMQGAAQQKREADKAWRDRVSGIGRGADEFTRSAASMGASMGMGGGGGGGGGGLLGGLF